MAEVLAVEEAQHVDFNPALVEALVATAVLVVALDKTTPYLPLAVARVHQAVAVAALWHFQLTAQVTAAVVLASMVKAVTGPAVFIVLLLTLTMQTALVKVVQAEHAVAS